MVCIHRQAPAGGLFIQVRLLILILFLFLLSVCLSQLTSSSSSSSSSPSSLPQSINKKGPADECGALHAHDQIISVNGVGVWGKQPEDIVAAYNLKVP